MTSHRDLDKSKTVHQWEAGNPVEGGWLQGLVCVWCDYEFVTGVQPKMIATGVLPT